MKINNTKLNSAVFRIKTHKTIQHRYAGYCPEIGADGARDPQCGLCNILCLADHFGILTLAMNASEEALDSKNPQRAMDALSFLNSIRAEIL